MVLGQPITATGSGGLFFSPWFPKGGNAAVFAVDVIQTTDLSFFDITVQTKKEQDDDSLAAAVGSAETITLTAGTRHSFTRGTGISGAGFEDLVRFKYSIEQEASPSYLGYVHFRMLDPSWISD